MKEGDTAVAEAEAALKKQLEEKEAEVKEWKVCREPLSMLPVNDHRLQNHRTSSCAQ